MTSQTADALRGRFGLAGVMVLAAALVAAVLVAIPAQYALAVALLFVGTAVVYRLPVISLSALVVAGVGPTLFMMTGRLSGGGNLILGKLSPADAIMSAMLLAVVLRAAASLTKPRLRQSGLTVALAACFTMLLAWIAVSLIRNLDVYGIHTIGQFRYSYLILVVPAYAAIFLRSAARRRRFFILLILFSVGVTLAALPVIGFLKGWGIGPGSRFFPSSVSLGLLYGWAALLLAGERGVLRVPKWLARALGFPVAAVLLVDSHRSVWLTGLVLVAYFLVVGRMSAAVLAKIVIFAAAVIGVVLAVTTVLGFDTLTYVVSRGSAIVNPAGDATSAWRLILWAANLARWWRHPLAGEGFGGYYGGNAVQGVSVTIGPHSLFVQTLVAMGAVGLALFIAVVVVAGVNLWTALKAQRSARQGSLDALVLELGLGILISAQAYWAVYAFDYYSCLWVGLALAAALAVGSRSPRPAQANT